MILVVDNYDSFTWNLVHLFAPLHAEIDVVRNDAITPEEILERDPDWMILSPGPGTPERAGCLVAIVKTCGPRIPTLGVCLGMQAIGVAFGGKVVHAPRLMHGKKGAVQHEGKDLFAGLPRPFDAGRYHSLVVDPVTLPECLVPLAHGFDGTLMGLRHREHPIVGVQFHPESILTDTGTQLARNFLRTYRKSGG